MGTRETYQRILVQACIVAGDETLLAQRLQVPVASVVDWLLGDAPVHSGAAVLETMKQFAPHAVLVDINMPGLDGYDVAKSLRTDYGHKVLVIGISGVYKKDSDRVLAGLVGIDHYLVKPYLASEVLELLETLRTPRIP